MKTIIIPDVHGRKTWKDIVNKEGLNNRYVFVGDYWDSFEIPFIIQEKNFLDIVEFKKSGKAAQVVTLLGNHDFDYLHDGKFNAYQNEISIVIKDHLKKIFFDIAFMVGDWIISHAGVSNTWMEKYGVLDVEEINEKFHEGYYGAFEFTGTDKTGDSVESSPIWIRPQSLLKDKAFNKQIVGHTIHKSVTIVDSVIFTDCHAFKNQYVCIEGNDIIIRSL